MTDLADPARLAAICARFSSAPYYKLLGMRAESDAPGRSRLTLPYSEKLTQLYGGIHGGALASMADSAVSIAAATTFSDEEANATVELTIQFLAPAGANDVVAEGRVVKRGAKLAFCEATLSAGGREIGRAQGICYIGSARKIDKTLGEDEKS